MRPRVTLVNKEVTIEENDCTLVCNICSILVKKPAVDRFQHLLVMN